MKIFFIKIIAVSLLTSIFFMASGFCFHSLLSPIIKLNVAQAAEQISINDCGEDKSNVEQVEKSGMPAPMAEHNNSLLPCCVAEGHPSAAIFSQATQINKFILELFFIEEQTIKTLPEIVVYQTPILPPPELLSLKSTILRI